MIFDSCQRSNKMLIHRHLADAQFGGNLAVLPFLAETQLEHALLGLGQSRADESLQAVQPFRLFFLSRRLLFEGIEVCHPLRQRLAGEDVATAVAHTLAEVSQLATGLHFRLTPQQFGKEFAHHVLGLRVVVDHGTGLGQQACPVLSEQRFQCTLIHLSLLTFIIETNNPFVFLTLSIKKVSMKNHGRNLSIAK